MRVTKISNYTGLEDKEGDLQLGRITPLVRDFNNDLITLFTAFQRRVRFGDGTAGHSENIDGEFVTYTSNGTANTEDTVSHTLGSIPIGYIVIKQDKGSSVYEGGTSWTTSNIYLKQTGTSVATTLFLLK